MGRGSKKFFYFVMVGVFQIHAQPDQCSVSGPVHTDTLARIHALSFNSAPVNLSALSVSDTAKHPKPREGQEIRA